MTGTFIIKPYNLMKNSSFRIALALGLFAHLGLVGCQSAEAPAWDPENPSFDGVVDNSEHLPGLIDSYRENATGELYMRLRPEQLERDYLYFATYLDGNADTDTSRGIFASHRTLRLERDFGVLKVLGVNTRFYFDPENALSRAADANAMPAVLAVADIVDENEDGEIMVRMGPVFLSESLQQIRPADDPDADPAATFVLGDLSDTRSRLQEVRVFPENLDLVVNYVYENPAPLVAGSGSVTDSRFVSVRLQHSLIAAPRERFEPRYEDHRIGYFTQKVTDMTGVEATPWRDPITRWKLVKKNPGAALSEPVEPILFWLENTTPEEYREVVRDAVLAWNAAFETAGFKNAVAVKVQPDDAEWDAADLRYNVLRWTSSSESSWGGYGPSWADPLTGEILGADIMLEFGWIRRYLARDRLFSDSLPELAAQRTGDRSRRCVAGAYKQSQLQLGRALLEIEPGSPLESELLRQSIYDLVTHEVGHTLGLNHNFRASQMLSPQQLASADVTRERGVTGSVMEYPATNYAVSGAQQALYYSMKPGPYDHWAIEFGYSEALSDPEAEQARLDAILARSTEPELAFGEDTAAMFGSESGIDPRVMVFDLSSDALAYAAERLTLLDHISGTLLQRFAEPGASWQELYNGYLAITGDRAMQFVVASRWIGGVYVDHSMQGQAGADVPLRPVELARQQQAMAMLREQLFAPDAWSVDQALYQHLQRQRRADNLWYQAQDPKLHARALDGQRRVLSHLLHPVTMTRITDSALYGNQYTLDRMMADLRSAIFSADQQAAVNSMRQQLQREYVEMLLAIVDPAAGSGHDYISRSSALYQLQQVQAGLQLSAKDAATRAHRAALQHRIETGLDSRG